MKYINSMREGMRIRDVYLCKSRQIQLTKNGKEYASVVLQDRSGTADGKIWDLGNPGISDFEAQDYVAVEADVTVYNGSIQLNIKRIRRADEGEYVPADYLPVSERDLDEMYAEILAIADTVKNRYLKALLDAFFREDKDFIGRFRFSSAAKTVHHGFVGGLMEHTIGVARAAEFMHSRYPYLNYDLLITASLCHDIGKVREINPFPDNDYSDDGQLLGHIVIGVEMLDEKLRNIPDFPAKLASELKHCIVAHHGEFEFGSPKKPAIAEALALNLADNADAKLELMKELLKAAGDNNGWLGFNKFVDSNIRKTRS